MLWTCAFAGCTRGNYISDTAGIADHTAHAGHAPVPGRAMGWIFDRSGNSPVINAVAPPTGPSAGATAMTVNGRGFTGATAVKIAAASCTAVTVVSDTQITCTSPAGTANSTQDVQVVTPHGVGVASGGWKYGA